MPYQYNCNKKCNYFRESQEKKRFVRRYYVHNHIGKTGLSIETNGSCWRIQDGNKQYGFQCSLITRTNQY